MIVYNAKTVEEDVFGLQECVICLDEFLNGTRILRIPTCKHFFHYECGKKWFDTKV